MSPGLIVICGPTATGKSGFAQRLAEQFSLPILNADSRQIYQDFSIGTAKPSLSDRQSADHYLVDEIEPTVTFTVADYQAQAQALIQNFHRQGITPILAGGTGLYIKSVTHGLIIPRVAPQPKLRSQLESWPQPILYQWLQQLDPVGATKVHANDHVRTLRALEVFYVTGRPLSAQQGEQPPSYPIFTIGLDIPDLEMHTQLIENRIHAMLKSGWVEEIQAIAQQYGKDLPLLKTLGYAEVLKHIQGQSSIQTAIEETVLHTRQFAKRQRTWFRALPDIYWLNPMQETTIEDGIKRCQNFLQHLQTSRISDPLASCFSS